MRNTLTAHDFEARFVDLWLKRSGGLPMQYRVAAAVMAKAEFMSTMGVHEAAFWPWTQKRLDKEWADKVAYLEELEAEIVNLEYEWKLKIVHSQEQADLNTPF